MLRDQRMEGMLEGMTGVGHGGRESYLDREVGQRAGPVQRTSGVVSARISKEPCR